MRESGVSPPESRREVDDSATQEPTTRACVVQEAREPSSRQKPNFEPQTPPKREEPEEPEKPEEPEEPEKRKECEKPQEPEEPQIGARHARLPHYVATKFAGLASRPRRHERCQRQGPRRGRHYAGTPGRGSLFGRKFDAIRIKKRN
jgi:hypothetical protein